jgi:hypothetical protein
MGTSMRDGQECPHYFIEADENIRRTVGKQMPRE